MPIIKCTQWKAGKLLGKIFGNEKASASVMADPTYVRYTVKHSIQRDVVRVTIFDNKIGSCAVKATGHMNYSYNPTVITSNTSLPISESNSDPLFIDVDEPNTNEIAAGIKLEQKIANAYVRLQATADKMNYENIKPYRIAEAVKNFEANKDVLTGKKA